VSDLAWFKPDGAEMSDEDWSAGFAKAIGVFLNGQELTERSERGGRVTDSSFLVLFNAGHDPVTFTLPERQWGRRWLTVLDTASGALPADAGHKLRAADDATVEPRTLVVLQRID
jgi:glycogen operon protein